MVETSTVLPLKYLTHEFVRSNVLPHAASLKAFMSLLEQINLHKQPYSAALRGVYSLSTIEEKLPLIFYHVPFSWCSKTLNLWWAQCLMSAWQKPNPVVWLWWVGTLRKPPLFEAPRCRTLGYIMVELCRVVLMLFLAKRRSAPEFRRVGAALEEWERRRGWGWGNRWSDRNSYLNQLGCWGLYES